MRSDSIHDHMIMKWSSYLIILPPLIPSQVLIYYYTYNHIKRLYPFDVMACIRYNL